MSDENINTIESNPSEVERNSVDTIVDSISRDMRFNPEYWNEEPKDNNGFYSIEEYVEAINYEPTEKPYLPYWGNLDLENIDLDKEQVGPREALGGLLKTASALKVEVPYFEGNSLSKEDMGKSKEDIQERITPEDGVIESIMTLEEMILEVYPGLERGIKQIESQIELAINNPKEFEKQFKGSNKDLRRWYSKVLPYAASLITVVVLAGCSSGSPNPELINSPTPRVSSTLEPTETPTQTPTSTETPTSTPTETLEPTQTTTSTPDPLWENTRENRMFRGYMIESSQLAMFQSTISDWTFEDEDIILKVNYLLYKKEFEYEFRISYPLQLGRYNSNGGYLGSTDLYRNQNKEDLAVMLNDIVENKKLCTLYLSIGGNTKVSHELVSQYVNDEVDLQFYLREISVSEGWFYDQFK